MIREETAPTPALKKRSNLLPYELYLGPIFKRKRLTAIGGMAKTPLAGGDSPSRIEFGYGQNSSGLMKGTSTTPNSHQQSYDKYNKRSKTTRRARPVDEDVEEMLDNKLLKLKLNQSSFM